MKFDHLGNFVPDKSLPENEPPTYEWFFDRTDSEGRVRIMVQWTMLDRTLGQSPPPWRDLVRGKKYLVRIDGGASSADCSILVRKGVAIRHDNIRIEVLDVEEVYYLETE